MSVVVILIAFSLLVAGGFLIAFLWAARNGQYDDDVSPAIRILFENDLSEPEHETETPANEPSETENHD